MKIKFYFLTFLVTISICVFNHVNYSQEQKSLDLMLNNIESYANSEEGGMHGRPLLQSVVDGGYKCGNCVGADCGAIC